MPKLKPTDKEQMDSRTKGIIAYIKAKCGYDAETLALRIGISASGLYRKMEDPQTLKLREIRLLVKARKLTKEQIIELIGVEV